MLFREANVAKHLAEEEKARARFATMGARRAARLDTLLDPRRRTMGVDAAHLATQEHELALAKADAAEASRREAAETARQEAAVKLMEREEEAATRERLRLAALQSATREQTDSWDLNDPRRVLKARPAREGLDDPRLGPCSAQVFAGEDPLQAERKALQQAQFKAWLVQVQGERDALAARERAEMMAFAARSDGTAATADEVERQVAALARARQVAAKEWNLREAELKAQARAAEKAESMAQDLQQCQTLLTRGAGMGLLAEHMAQGVSHADPARIRKDYYRGRESASGEALMQGYKDQMVFRERDRAEQAALDKRLAAEALEHNRLAAKVERATEEQRRRADREMREALDRGAEELRRRREAERAEARKPGFGDAFFEAFGKTDF